MQNISFGFRLEISLDCKDKSTVLCNLAKILANTCTNKGIAGNNLVAFSFPDTARFRRGQLGVHTVQADRKLKYFFVKSDIRKQWDCLGCAGRQKIELLLTIGNKVMASQECSDIYLDLRQFVNSGFKKGGSSVDTDNDANNLH